MANQSRRRHPLLPWWIGLIIILAAIGYAAFRFSCDDCGAAALPEFLVLAAVPLVYLTLMYLLFRGQSDDERRNRKDYDPR